MAKLGTILQTVPSEIRTSSSTQETVLGAHAETPDGRGFRYVLNGATALIPGTLVQSAAETTAHQALTPTAAAVGDTSLTVTLGGTAAEVDEYKDGFAITSPGPVGEMYGIAGHPYAAASAAVVLTLSEPIKTAIPAGTLIDLVRNPYRQVVINPTTPTGSPVGVALHAIAASQFGWLQTHGPVAVLAIGALVVGTHVTGTDTAGAVASNTAFTTATPIVGVALTGVATSEYGAVYLTLD